MRFRKSYIIMPVVVLMVILCIRVVYLMNTQSPARRHRAAGWHQPIASTRPTADSTEPTPLILGQSSDYDFAQLAANTGNRLSMTSSRSGSRVSPAQRRPESEMVVVVVACMMRLSETLNMIKSALIFHVDQRPLRFVVITEASLMQAFSEKLEDWQTATKYAFEFDILPLKFPEVNTKEWRDLFKPCASQRLFLPNLLTTTDAVLYVDTDTVFLSPVSRIWSLFAQFNATQMAGLSPEHEDKNVGWYNRFARHPFYGPLGVNSGVMLMNLTRMRSFKWVDYILPLHKEYKLKITWGDQDLINILFHFHPDKLFVFPCEWNYRPDHCMYMPVCKAPHGVHIMHGNRGSLHAGAHPAFSATYTVVERYQLGDDRYRNVLMPLESALNDDEVTQTNCGHNVDKLLVVPRQVLKESADYYFNEVQH